MANKTIDIKKINEFLITPNGKITTLAVVVLIATIVFTLIYITSIPSIPEIGAPPRRTQTQNQQQETKLSEEEKAEIEKFQVFQGKDPFMPLIDLEVDSETASEGATPTEEGTTPTGETDTQTGTETGESQPVQQNISLLDIFYEGDILFASIQINGTAYKVKEQDIFASNYQVLALIPNSATLIYGDDTIVLNLGDTISK